MGPESHAGKWIETLFENTVLVWGTRDALDGKSEGRKGKGAGWVYKQVGSEENRALVEL